MTSAEFLATYHGCVLEVATKVAQGTPSVLIGHQNHKVLCQVLLTSSSQLHLNQKIIMYWEKSSVQFSTQILIKGWYTVYNAY